VRIRILSDLHFEFEPPEVTADFNAALALEDTPVCILAGDIATVSCFDRVGWLAQRWPDTEFLWTFGNHELYGSSFASATTAAEEVMEDLPNLQLFNRAEFDHPEGPGAIIGATLWYPPDDIRGWVNWADRHHIHNPIELFYEAGRDYEYLKSKVHGDHVVVTHMLPHEQCVQPPWKGERSNAFFVHDCSDLLLQTNSHNRPPLWIHGHTHESVNERVGDTWIVCNPRGYYPDKRNPNFDPLFEIDTDEL
jgi:hypothetical protein